MKDSRIIHIFALLHVAAAVSVPAFGLKAEFLLTPLTVIMLTMLCLRKSLTIEGTMITLLCGLTLGYAFGKMFFMAANGLNLPERLVRVLPTFCTTELIGFGFVGISKWIPASRWGNDRREKIWIIASAVVIYLARTAVSFIHRFGLFDLSSLSGESLFVFYSFTVIACAVGVFLLVYALASRNATDEEIIKRHKAQFRYMRLKQQVNPHFLFNSLNTLDCMVAEGDGEKARDYIHKLSSVYRYMLKNEEERLVELREEMEFVNMFFDLLKVRFGDGIRLDCDIPAEKMTSMVVPCSIQLTVENAAKHNVAGPSAPLVIGIFTDGDYLTVTNNLIPKNSPSEGSPGIGQKYVLRQYQDIAGKEIKITRSENSYSVTLPLL